MKIDENDFIKSKDFNYQNIKYKNSSFFMSIYRKKLENENVEKSEDNIFDEALDSFMDSIKRIIL